MYCYILPYCFIIKGVRGGVKIALIPCTTTIKLLLLHKLIKKKRNNGHCKLYCYDSRSKGAP